MRRFVVLTTGVVTLMGLAACQDQMMSNDRMASSIAGVLGVPPSDLSLTNRRSDGATNTYVLAHVTGGKTYACTINGGGLLAMGLMAPPSCQPAAAQ